VNSRSAALALVALAGCLGPVEKKGGGPVAYAPSPTDRGLVRLEAAAWPALTDDAPRPALARALRASVDFYARQPGDRIFLFGTDAYTAAELAVAYGRLADDLPGLGLGLTERVRRDFIVYMSAGTDADRTVVFSSYYEHELPASLKKTDRYRYPPLRASPRFGGARLPARGQNRRAAFGRRNPPLPHPGGNRFQGGSAGARSRNRLGGRPGAGVFPSGSGIGLVAVAQRGATAGALRGKQRPSLQIGGRESDRDRCVARSRFSRRAMVAFLEKSPQRQSYLNVNPRYVFFQIDRSANREKVFGSINAPLTGGRSVATDFSLFPAGALGWMEAREDIPVARYILNQDEGGAIKGPGRVDFFAGGGPEAEKFAVSFWERGRLYFLAPRGGATGRARRKLTGPRGGPAGRVFLGP
jgi:membrane-bound lytic murein transglycosylase A